MSKRPPKPSLRPSSRDYHKILGTWSAVVATLTAIVVGYFQIAGAGQVAEVSTATSTAPPQPSEARPASPEPAPVADSVQPRSSRPDLASRPPRPGGTQVVPPISVQTVPRPALLTQTLPNADIRLRAEPNANSETVAVIHPGQDFWVGERVGDWFYARLPSGTRGFVRADLVEQGANGVGRVRNDAQAGEQSVNSQR